MSLPFLYEPVQWARERRGDHRVFVRRTADQINRETLDWIDRTVPEERPYFAFLNYFDVHDPYERPDGYDAHFSPPGGRYWVGPWGIVSLSEEDTDAIRVAYEESFAFLDERLATLFDELERRGRLENTLVVVTSDHGEQFGEHGLYVHGNSLYMPVLRVPLLIVDPAGDVPSGMRIDTRVTLNDLAATILELAGAPSLLPGRSLSRTWSGDTAEPPMFTRADPRDPWWSRLGVIHQDWSYVRNYGGPVFEELYDLDADPSELDNRALSQDSASVGRLMELRALFEEANPMSEPERTGSGPGAP